MAEIEDVPDGVLRDIAFRVPAACRGAMSALELRLRCEYVHELQSRKANEAPDKAIRTARLAERVIHSVSDYSYTAARDELAGRLADAQRRGDSQAAGEAWQELNSLPHREPRLPPARFASHATAVITAEAERRLAIPPAQHSRLFRRGIVK